MNPARKTLMLATALTWLAGTLTLNAGVESNPRALAMGGAYTALAYGLEAANYCAANLGLSGNRPFTFDFFSLGVDLRNNSFSLEDYNKYNGKYLTEEDKSEILGKIPGEGLRLDLGAEVRSLNLSVWRLALTLRGVGESAVRFDRDPFALLLYGNVSHPDIQLDDTRGEAMAYADGALSYGQALKRWSDGELAVGATLHYLYGVAYEKITEATGGIFTTDTGYVGNGHMTVRSALGGSGQALDLGVAVRFAKNWAFSAGWHNFYSSIKWQRETEERVFTFDMQPVSFQTLQDEELNDSLVTTTDTTYDIAPFQTTLPSTIKLGLARTGKKLTWAIDWTQTSSSRLARSTNPRVGVGLEYKLISLLPLRVGVATGGNSGTSFSGGFGLHLGFFHIDLAASSYGAIAGAGSRGTAIAASAGLRF